MPIEIEDLLEGFKSSSLSTMDLNIDNLQTLFRNETKRLAGRIQEEMPKVRNVEDYVYDSLEQLRTVDLKREMEKIQTEFLDNYKKCVKEIDEISSMRLDPFELDSRLRRVVSRFEAYTSIPNPNFIENYCEEFKQFFFKKYSLYDDIDLRFGINKLINKYSDTLMGEFYDTNKKYQNDLLEKLNSKAMESKEILGKFDEQLEKIDDVDKSLDPNKPIDTNGKSEEQLRNEEEIMLERIMNDPSLSLEDKLDLHKKVSMAYENAIKGMSNQLEGQIDIKGKTVIDLENEKRIALERITSNPSLDITEAFEEIERVSKLYDAAILAVSPINEEELKGKNQTDLAYEKEAAINAILSNEDMTYEQKMEMYDRVSAQYDEAISRAPQELSRLESLLL